MLPPGDSIYGRLTSDLPLGCLQGGFAEINLDREVADRVERGQVEVHDRELSRHHPLLILTFSGPMTLRILKLSGPMALLAFDLSGPMRQGPDA